VHGKTQLGFLCVLCVSAVNYRHGVVGGALPNWLTLETAPVLPFRVKTVQ